jgi:hypothetical protein
MDSPQRLHRPRLSGLRLVPFGLDGGELGAKIV